MSIEELAQERRLTTSADTADLFQDRLPDPMVRHDEDQYGDVVGQDAALAAPNQLQGSSPAQTTMAITEPLDVTVSTLANFHEIFIQVVDTNAVIEHWPEVILEWRRPDDTSWTRGDQFWEAKGASTPTYVAVIEDTLDGTIEPDQEIQIRIHYRSKGLITNVRTRPNPGPAKTPHEVSVSNSNDLLAAVRNDTTIILEDGTYKLDHPIRMRDIKNLNLIARNPGRVTITGFSVEINNWTDAGSGIWTAENAHGEHQYSMWHKERLLPVRPSLDTLKPLTIKAAWAFTGDQVHLKVPEGNPGTILVAKLPRLLVADNCESIYISGIKWMGANWYEERTGTPRTMTITDARDFTIDSCTLSQTAAMQFFGDPIRVTVQHCAFGDNPDLLTFSGCKNGSTNRNAETSATFAYQQPENAAQQIVLRWNRFQGANGPSLYDCRMNGRPNVHPDRSLQGHSIYENSFHACYDDSIELGGTAIGITVRNNIVHGSGLSFLSLAPHEVGPVFCSNNLVFRCGTFGAAETAKNSKQIIKFQAGMPEQPKEGALYQSPVLGTAVIRHNTFVYDPPTGQTLTQPGLTKRAAGSWLGYQINKDINYTGLSFSDNVWVSRNGVGWFRFYNEADQSEITTVVHQGDLFDIKQPLGRIGNSDHSMQDLAASFIDCLQHPTQLSDRYEILNKIPKLVAGKARLTHRGSNLTA